MTDSMASARFQRVLDALVGHCCYGPLQSDWDEDRGQIVAGNRWAWRSCAPAVPDAPRRYPIAATCSPLVGLALGLYLGAGALYDPAWGRSIALAIRGDAHTPPSRVLGPAAVLWRRPQARTWWRSWIWDHLPAGGLPTPVCVALYRGHVVLAVDCDVLERRDPRDRSRCRGVWVLAADGSYSDQPDGQRVYSCTPLRWEPALIRHLRERDRPAARRKFALIGIRTPRPGDRIASAQLYVEPSTASQASASSSRTTGGES